MVSIEKNYIFGNIFKICKFIYFEKQVNAFLTGKFQLALILQSLPDSSSGSKILQLTCSIMWEKQLLSIV